MIGRLGCWQSRLDKRWSGRSWRSSRWLALGSGSGCWGEFKQRLELKQSQRRLLSRFGRIGLAVRSVMFTMIGVLLLSAAPTANFREAKGFAGALQIIQQQSYGSELLGIT